MRATSREILAGVWCRLFLDTVSFDISLLAFFFLVSTLGPIDRLDCVTFLLSSFTSLCFVARDVPRHHRDIIFHRRVW
jgi:hypothetical protein